MLKQLQQRVAARPARAQPLRTPEINRLSPGDPFWIVAFLLPFMVLYLGFTLWPLLATFIYSFFDWDGSKPLDQFVALENYQTILRDPIFWRAFWNTLIFSIGNTLIKLPLSLLAALVLTRKWLWFKSFFRTIYFVPIIIPVAMAGLIFTLLLNPANGALNDFLVSSGLISRPIDFLGRPVTAMLCLILVSVWQIFGQYMIYWMAALQNVPEEMYEAAELDGANEWDKLVSITLPIIRPLAIIISSSRSSTRGRSSVWWSRGLAVAPPRPPTLSRSSSTTRPSASFPSATAMPPLRRGSLAWRCWPRWACRGCSSAGRSASAKTTAFEEVSHERYSAPQPLPAGELAYHGAAPADRPVLGLPLSLGAHGGV
ncbi:sugar ABC transporter permease [Candidatus Gracilibacteria bacterium]|nr:sugar ABC transporter permease [Candidatus Gracilibacteria bacterium]